MAPSADSLAAVAKRRARRAETEAALAARRAGDADALLEVPRAARLRRCGLADLVAINDRRHVTMGLW